MTLPKPLFTRASYVPLSGFILTLFLLSYFWQPLTEEYLALIDWQLNWLLISIFLVMTPLLVKADKTATIFS